VHHHRFQYFLEMPLILMARFASYTCQLCCEDYYSVSYDMITNEMADMNPLQYAIFGRLTKGDETLKKLEQLPTRREGIFVMVIFS
jgi:cyclophilin family peptidyl-prolyl cis-trans isomerase